MKIWILATLLILNSTPIYAFTLNSSSDSNLEGWSNSTIRLRVNTANCPAGFDVPALISDAAEVWNNVPTSSLKVKYDGSTTSTAMSSPVTVYCETNFQALLGADQNAVPGAASVDGSSGRIRGGILYLNVSAGLANIENFNYQVLKIILAHEIGHILGLGHSEDKKALMYFDGSDRDHLSLGQDDMDGVSYLYPSDELKEGKYAGCGVIEGPRVPPNQNLWISLLLFLLPIALVVWLRKNKAQRC